MMTWQARHTGIKIVQQIAILLGCSVLPHLRSLVEIIEGGLQDEQQKVRTSTALSLAASDSYACAAPVDERCVALLRSGAVWSIEHHALVPAHERLAASARALLMGVKRWDAQGEPYEVDIGPARGGDREERHLPREVWELIFSFLIFEEGYRDARPAKRRRKA